MNEHICGECKYCTMYYDKQDWEIYACNNEDGRGCDDPEDEACKNFEEDEA